MKKIFIIFVVAYMYVFAAQSQGYRDLGQTKTYLIKTYEDCYISLNQRYLYINRCQNMYSLFLFDQNTNLCTLKAFETPLLLKEAFMANLTKEGFKYVKDVGFPAYNLVGNKFENRSARGELYINNTYIVTVLEGSLMGIDETLFGIVYERCEDKNGGCNVKQ